MAFDLDYRPTTTGRPSERRYPTDFDTTQKNFHTHAEAQAADIAAGQRLAANARAATDAELAGEDHVSIRPMGITSPKERLETVLGNIVNAVHTLDYTPLDLNLLTRYGDNTNGEHNATLQALADACKKALDTVEHYYSISPTPDPEPVSARARVARESRHA